MSKKTEKKDSIIFKIITLGNSGVGKTSILRRFIYDNYTEDTMATIGISMSYKDITLSNGKEIKLKLIDTAGQEKYMALAKTYYKNADGVFFIFGFDDKNSVESIKMWVNEFNENNKTSGNYVIPRYLIGNKSDIDINQRDVKEDFIEKFRKEFNIDHYETTSAKDNININKIFLEISEMIYKNYEKLIGKEQKAIAIDNYKKDEKNCAQCFSGV